MRVSAGIKCCADRPPLTLAFQVVFLIAAALWKVHDVLVSNLRLLSHDVLVSNLRLLSHDVLVSNLRLLSHDVLVSNLRFLSYVF